MVEFSARHSVSPPANINFNFFSANSNFDGCFSLTVHGEFGLFIDLVEPDGLVQFDLGVDGARVPLLVDPLHGEGVVAVEAADLTHGH